jgi:membrane-associated phospholipid phosphatase
MPASRQSGVGRLLGPVNPIFAGIAVVAGVLFTVLAVLVALHPAPFPVDRTVELDVQSITFSPLTPFNTFMSWLGGFVAVAIGLAIIGLTFIVRRAATPFVVFSALYFAVYNLANYLIHRPRPTGVPHTTHELFGYSFPSGHVGFFVWVGVLTLVLLARGLPRALFIVCCVLVAALVAAVALSRMYVGAHWLSDVVGGFLVGAGWTSLSLSLGRLTRPVLTPVSDAGRPVGDPRAPPP